MKQIHIVIFVLLAVALGQESQPSLPPSQQIKNQATTRQIGESDQKQRRNPQENASRSRQQKQALQKQYENQRNLNQPHRPRVRNFKNKFQFPVKYQVFLVYSLFVCGLFLVIYVFSRCLRKCKQRQSQRVGVELKQRYLKYHGENKQKQSIILPTFCPQVHNQQFHKFEEELMQQQVKSPTFGVNK